MALLSLLWTPQRCVSQRGKCPFPSALQPFTLGNPFDSEMLSVPDFLCSLPLYLAEHLLSSQWSSS